MSLPHPPSLDPQNQGDGLWPAGFREAYCHSCRCAPDDFAREVFRRILCRRHYWLCRAIFLVYPRYFARDFITIHKLGAARNRREFQHSLNVFHRVEVGSLRVNWHLRISGRRAMELMQEVASEFPEMASESFPLHRKAAPSKSIR